MNKHYDKQFCQFEHLALFYIGKIINLNEFDEYGHNVNESMYINGSQIFG